MACAHPAKAEAVKSALRTEGTVIGSGKGVGDFKKIGFIALPARKVSSMNVIVDKNSKAYVAKDEFKREEELLREIGDKVRGLIQYRMMHEPGFERKGASDKCSPLFWTGEMCQ